VSFRRGRPGEAQRCFELAADRSATPAERHERLRLASGAAAARNFGAAAVELLERAAGATDDPDAAAEALAMAAMYRHRCQGIMGRPVLGAETAALLERARACGGSGPRAAAAIAMAEGWAPGFLSRSRAQTEEALALAGRAGDPLLHNIVLDQLIAVEMAQRDLGGALAAVRARLALLAPLPVDARSGFEHYDALHMGCRLFLAVGDLAAARRHADGIAALPFFREERHVGLGRRVEVEVMAGDFAAVVAGGELIERDWARAGRPVAGNLAVGAYCVATAHAMLGDGPGHRRWVALTEELLGTPVSGLGNDCGWVPALDALVVLHTDGPAAAVQRLTSDPDGPEWANPNSMLWLPWYAATWAEAAALAGHPDTAERIDRATRAARANPIALTVLDRSAAVAAGQLHRLPEMAARFAAAGCAYQHARTLRLATPP
ncbi:hypothetical protein, partial [Pseudonocardia lacus]|uniref:hypothetical protein n=1 Tax=Pseudonocardia lacus TaxID=2835865 RepID=UPI001BDBD01A